MNPRVELSDHDVSLLARATGIPLARYRREHVQRCVERGLLRSRVGDPASLAALLRRDERAHARFRRSVLVSVTRMFRDAREFDILAQRVLPELRTRLRRPVRVWSAGCATGEELHSVALLLERAGMSAGARLVGTDPFDESLRTARERSGYAQKIGAAVRFERRDLLTDGPPAGDFDLVLCRNVVIYLAVSERAAAYGTLVSAMGPFGYLMLGTSERLVQPRQFGLGAVTRHVYGREAA